MKPRNKGLTFQPPISMAINFRHINEKETAKEHL